MNPFSKYILIAKKILPFRISFETLLIISIVCITSSVSYTAYLAYQSLVQLTEAVGKESESEVKLLLIKGINGDLAATESHIKSFGLSKEKSYLEHYSTSLRNAREGMLKLNNLIPDTARQQRLFDSIDILIQYKTNYLEAYAGIQHRGSVVNELNKLTTEIEQNKKILAYYLGDSHTEKKREEAKPKAGLLKRIFHSKSIRKEQEDSLNSQRQVAINRLNNQIRMMEKVKDEIGHVKHRQGSTLKSIDQEELSIIQQNKLLNEQLNACFVALEMEELAHTRMIIEDIDKRHNRTDKLISIFSVLGAVFLIIIGFVVVSFLRRKNAYQVALLSAKNEAEQYSVLQEQFLANMSHEIRTPMNAISGFTEQLLKTRLETKQYSYLQIVHQSVNYLLVIINDILDYAKLKADKLSIEQTIFSVNDVLADSLALIQDLASAKGIKLKTEIPAEIKDELKSDPVRLKQILLNVLGNALKFTHEGEVVVSLNSKETRSKTSLIEIKIRDTGIGISEKNLSRIFNAFEQAEISTSRKFGGSGLGLSITRKLVQLLNGTIHLTSTEGKGTEVLLLFEWERSSGEQQEVISTGFSMDAFSHFIRNKKILVADDEEWNTTLLAAILEPHGAIFTIVRNGKEALQEMSTKLFDLVLMDVRMPEIDGFEASRQIRHLPQPGSGVAIIGITADMTPRQVKQCYESGMNAVLGKPYTELQLCEMIYQTVLHPEHHQMPYAIADTSGRETDSGESYSTAVLRDMSNGDAAFEIKMLNIFIRNGRQAFDQMTVALNNNNLSEIADLAHKITPAARQLDAKGLEDLLKQLETAARQEHQDRLHTLIEKANSIFGSICKSMQKTIEQLEK